MDNGTHYDKTEAMKSLEERVTALETNWLTLADAIIAMIRNTMGSEMPKPAPGLPFEPLEPAPQVSALSRLHFNLDAHQRAHWADVYSRLVSAGKLRSCEVSCTNFTYQLCGVGTPSLAPVRWYGTTRELAYMVRRHLNSKWEVALIAFKDKKGNELPRTLKNTNAPNANSAKIIDMIFQTKN